MKLFTAEEAWRRARHAWLLTGAACLLTCALSAAAQAPSAESKPFPPNAEPGRVQTFFLKNAAAQQDLNDIQTGLRNLLPRAKIYGIATDDAITIRATDEDIEAAQRYIAEVDRPKKAYRVTYRITDVKDGKHMPPHNIVVLVTEQGKTVVRQGNRVPILTATEDSDAHQNSQVQYLDAGLNLEAAIFGPQLHTKLELSAISDEKSSVGMQDPIIRQTLFEGSSPLPLGKPMLLGVLDVPGSTNQQEIEVSAELVQ